MKKIIPCCVLMLMLVIAGCQTAPKKAQSDQEVMTALESVTQGLTNQDISQADLKRLGQQMKKDPEARSALKSVNTAFSVQDTGVKYCPKDGKRYSKRLENCPEHNVKLLPVE